MLALLSGLWHAWAYYHLAVGESGFRLVARGEPVTDTTLQRVETSRLRAEAILPWAGRPSKDLGLVELYRAGQLSTPGAARPSLRRAARRFERGLGRDPVDARAWFELAWTYWKLGWPRDAAHALALSYLTSPHAPPLAASRIELATALWVFLPGPVAARAVTEFCSLPEALREELDRRAAVGDAFRRQPCDRMAGTSSRTVQLPLDGRKRSGRVDEQGIEERLS